MNTEGWCITLKEFVPGKPDYKGCCIGNLSRDGINVNRNPNTEQAVKLPNEDSALCTMKPTRWGTGISKAKYATGLGMAPFILVKSQLIEYALIKR